MFKKLFRRCYSNNIIVIILSQLDDQRRCGPAVVRWDVSGPVSSNGYNKNREGPMPEEFLAKRSHGICKFARFIPSYTTEAIRMYYALPYGRMLQPIRLSVCLSVPCSR